MGMRRLGCSLGPYSEAEDLHAAEARVSQEFCCSALAFGSAPQPNLCLPPMRSSCLLWCTTCDSVYTMETLLA